MYPDLQYPAVPEVVSEHPASNGSVRELEERRLGVRRWDPHGRMQGWIDQILQLEPPAIPGTWGPHL